MQPLFFFSGSPLSHILAAGGLCLSTLVWVVKWVGGSAGDVTDAE